MKRFWLVLLSLGLVMAFSVSAFAVDVKVSGEYYAAGLYLDKTNVNGATIDAEPAVAFVPGVSNAAAAKAAKAADVSTSFFFQRLRIGTDFIVSPCLKLVTRFDAMEREWGMRAGDDADPKTDAGGAVKPRTQENIEFDVVYVDYVSPIGKFQVGYMPDYMWGTIWGNRTTGPTAGQIKYFLPIGPVTLIAAYAKEADNDYSVKNTAAAWEDRDFDSYRVGPIFSFNTEKVAGDAGVLFIYNQTRNYRGLAFAPPISVPFSQNMYVLQPYFNVKVGPLALQGEANYAWGTRSFEAPIPLDDQRIDSLTFFLNGDANFGLFSAGGSFAYVQGDDDPSKINDALTGGRDWDPCLIMFNNTTTNSWVGPISGYNAVGAIDGEMTNAWFVQARASVTPVPEFTGMVSVSAAIADKNMGYSGKDRGWEVDVTGTYKISTNLSYMLGAGYFFTGDYYKGITGADINDNYMLINKLTLTF